MLPQIMDMQRELDQERQAVATASTALQGQPGVLEVLAENRELFAKASEAFEAFESVSKGELALGQCPQCGYDPASGEGEDADSPGDSSSAAVDATRQAATASAGSEVVASQDGESVPSTPATSHGGATRQSSAPVALEPAPSPREESVWDAARVAALRHVCLTHAADDDDDDDDSVGSEEEVVTVDGSDIPSIPSPSRGKGTRASHGAGGGAGGGNMGGEAKGTPAGDSDSDDDIAPNFVRLVSVHENMTWELHRYGAPRLRVCCCDHTPFTPCVLVSLRAVWTCGSRRSRM